MIVHRHTNKAARRSDLGPVTNAEATPMAALDVDRRRDVVHDLTGIAAIGLQQEGLLVRPAALAHRVIEESLGAVVHEIDLFVSGQRLREFPVVRRHIAVAVDADGVHRAMGALRADSPAAAPWF
jgi:hypothetical protein